MTTDVDARLSTQPPHSWWSLRDNHSCVTHTIVATTSQLQPHGFPHVDTPLDTGIARLQSPASPGSQPDSSHRCDIVIPASTVASPPASTRLSRQRHSHASTAAGSHRDSRSTALSPACPHPLMASSRQGRARTDRLSRHSVPAAVTVSTHRVSDSQARCRFRPHAEALRSPRRKRQSHASKTLRPS